MPKTTGDDLFERYLREHRYDPGPHEPDLSEHGIETRPDYVVTRDGVRVACEVEQFKAGGSKLEKRMASQRFGWASDKEVYGRIRNRVGHAAQQLKPLTALELPMLVVLANPEGAFVDLSVEHVLASLYGNPTYTMQIDTSTGGAVGEGRFEFGRDGKLTNDHPYLSGIALLRRREHKTDAVDEIAAQQQDEAATTFEDATEQAVALFKRLEGVELPEGDYLYLDVIEATSESAVRIPEDWFDGPRDSRWQLSDEGFFERVRGPASKA